MHRAPKAAIRCRGRTALGERHAVVEFEPASPAAAAVRAGVGAPPLVAEVDLPADGGGNVARAAPRRSWWPAGRGTLRRRGRGLFLCDVRGSWRGPFVCGVRGGGLGWCGQLGRRRRPARTSSRGRGPRCAGSRRLGWGGGVFAPFQLLDQHGEGPVEHLSEIGGRDGVAQEVGGASPALDEHGQQGDQVGRHLAPLGGDARGRRHEVAVRQLGGRRNRDHPHNIFRGFARPEDGAGGSIGARDEVSRDLRPARAPPPIVVAGHGGLRGDADLVRVALRSRQAQPSTIFEAPSPYLSDMATVGPRRSRACVGKTKTRNTRRRRTR